VRRVSLGTVNVAPFLAACLGSGGGDVVVVTPCGEDLSVPIDAGNSGNVQYGLFVGPLCINAVATSVLRATDRCTGEASIEVGEDGVVHGAGSCSFEGGGRGPTIQSFLPDTYGGTLTGMVNGNSQAMGELEVRTSWGDFGSAWSGEFVGDYLVGQFAGRQQIEQEGIDIDLAFDGAFAVRFQRSPDTGGEQ
jgi:hypothetical protein